MESFGKRGQTGKGAVLRAGISSGSPIFKRASGAACGSIFTDLCAEKQCICDYLAGVLRNGDFRDKFVERRLFTGGGDAGGRHASGARRAGNYGARVSERVCTDFYRRDVTRAASFYVPMAVGLATVLWRMARKAGKSLPETP